MVTGRVSVILPSRNETFLAATVIDLLAKCQGDLEIIVVLDGYWPNPYDLPRTNPRVRILHKGAAEGMRQGINSAAAMATGEYLLKLDAHCMVAEGFDLALKADYHERNWVVVPRRYPLDPFAWAIEKRADHKYPVDAHALSYPYRRPGDPNCGLHGDVWKQRREARQDVLIDEEMSSQGSCWFMGVDHWRWMGDLDHVSYGPFFQEFQEIGNKTWLGGGQVMVNKKTWYAHLRKSNYKLGHGYSMADFRRDEVTAFTADYWMRDSWPRQVRSLRWLIERFSPVPTWPDSLDEAFDPRKRYQRRGEPVDV